MKYVWTTVNIEQRGQATRSIKRLKTNHKRYTPCEFALEIVTISEAKIESRWNSALICMLAWL